MAARQYDHGVTPAVALQFWLVEVHKSQNNDTLWYRVGTQLQGDQIIWGPSRQYDHGVTPAVATAGQIVVEVHKSENNDTLWYHVGTIQGDRINWGPSRQYDHGVTPAVVVGGQTVIEVQCPRTTARCGPDGQDYLSVRGHIRPRLSFVI